MQQAVPPGLQLQIALQQSVLHQLIKFKKANQSGLRTIIERLTSQGDSRGYDSLYVLSAGGHLQTILTSVL